MKNLSFYHCLRSVPSLTSAQRHGLKIAKVAKELDPNDCCLEARENRESGYTGRESLKIGSLGPGS